MLEQQRLRHILDLASDYVALTDADGVLQYLNTALATLVGPAAADLSHLHLTDLYVRPSARILRESALPAAAAEDAWRGELVMRGHAGRELRVAQLVAAQADGFALLSRPAGRELRIAHELGAAEWRFQRVVEQLPVVTYVTLLDQNVPATYLSPQFEALVGYTPLEAASDSDLFLKLLHPDDRDRVLAEHHRVIARGERLDVEYRFVARDGRVVWIHDRGDIVSEEGQPPFLQGCLMDITTRKLAEEERDRLVCELDALATTDPVTGALNHRGGVAALDYALAEAELRGKPFGLLFVDLDRFKQLNDAHGHSAGDLVLATFKRVAEACLREPDTICRWGGEEFVVVLPGADPPAALAIAERIRDVVASNDFELGADRVSCSIGVASFPADGRSREQLVQAADQAMYAAKARGGNQVTAADRDLDLFVALTPSK
jgi:diguanylate cyclase (GGDEF)-like protein/PAS domain S-box-containing protein